MDLSGVDSLLLCFNITAKTDIRVFRRIKGSLPCLRTPVHVFQYPSLSLHYNSCENERYCIYLAMRGIVLRFWSLTFPTVRRCVRVHHPKYTIPCEKSAALLHPKAVFVVLCGGVLKHQWQVEMFRTRLEEGDALSRELRGSLAEAEGRAAQEKVPWPKGPQTCGHPALNAH